MKSVLLVISVSFNKLHASNASAGHMFSDVHVIWALRHVRYVRVTGQEF